MALYKYLRQAWQNPSEEMQRVLKERLILWRKQPSTVRLDHPTRLDRARSLGYKAKQGYLIIRQRVSRKARQRPKFHGGRRPKHMRRLKVLAMNYQWVAEQRAAKKFVNCEVLNSYEIAKDGQCMWFEIILVDKNHPAIKADKRISWIGKPANTKRVSRGLTSAGKRARGILTHKGKGAEKLRSTVKRHAKRGFQESRVKRHIEQLLKG